MKPANEAIKHTPHTQHSPRGWHTISGLAHALKSVCGVAALSTVFILSLLVSTQTQAQDTLTAPNPGDQTFTDGQTVDLRLQDATGGLAPYTYTLQGMRPGGLTYDDATRRLTGTLDRLTVLGEFDMIYAVTDSASGIVGAAFRITVEAAVNSPATGSPEITGTPTSGSTLTAVTTDIADPDGIPTGMDTFSYQWLQSQSPITGATSKTFLLTAEQESTGVTVAVSFTDNIGFPEARTSALVVVTAPNSAAQGLPTITSRTITGTPIAATPTTGSDLIANIDGIMDGNGISPDAFNYQWQADEVNIDGQYAIGQTFTLTEAEEGTAVRVAVSFRDDASFPEGPLYSAAVNAVAAPLRAPVFIQIDNIKVQSGVASIAIELSDYFTDPDGDTLTYDASAIVVGSGTMVPHAINTTTGRLTITPAGVVTTRFTVSADDGDLFTDQTFDVEVVEADNAAPSANMVDIPSQSLTMGGTTTLSNLGAYFTEPDVGDTLIYTAEVSSAGASAVTVVVNGDSLLITGLVVPDPGVMLTINLQATDGVLRPTIGEGQVPAPLRALRDIAVTVNAAPTFGTVFVDQTFTEGVELLPLTLPVATGGTGTLSYTLDGDLPTGLSFTDSDRMLSGTPTLDDAVTTPQISTLTYKATDANDVSVTQAFTVTINPALALLPVVYTFMVNEEIPLTTLPPATGGMGGVLSYTLTTPSGDDLPDWLIFDADADTRTLSGTPTVTETIILTYTVTESDSASDGASPLGTTFTTLTITIIAPPSTGGGSRPTNTVPVADAGDPQTVAGGATVSLNGGGSSDPDSDTLSYAWSQTDNDAPRVTLHGASTATPSFTAPGGLSAAAVLEFSLTVRDRSLSSTDTVAITVLANEAPAADAGDPQTVAEGATVSLNGSGSSDSDGNSLSYAWSQTDNDAPRVTLRGADTATPSFTAPSELSAAAVLVFSLTVSDGNLSSTATVTITVTQLNEAPAADAGDPQTVDEGATVSLDGRGSSDPDGDSLSYAWSQTDNGAPRVTLRGADTATPGFTAPSLLSADAVLEFSLSVSDGNLSTTATVTISVIYVNDAPDADAGAPQTVAEGATVTLSGSGTDPDGEDAALSYAWSQTDNDAPRVSLRGANTATPSFTAPSRLSAAAVLDFTLTVTDAAGATGTGQVQITVATDVAARQQALEVTLAAFGRSVATGAVDAISHRLKPASTEARTSRLGGSSLAACAASAPADAADTARAAGTTATPWPNPNGNDNDNNLTDNRAGSSCRLPSRAQLAQSTFLMSLNGLSETATAGTDTEGWSLWGRGDLSRFEGRPQHEFSLDGEVMAGYLGLDYRLESGGLIGLALSRSSGDIDYRRGAAEGELSIDLNTVYPYGYWSPHAGLSLWGLLGIGRGDATLTHSAMPFETDVGMRMGALGGRQALHAAGGFELALKADAFMVELDSDAELGLPAVTAQASRARLMLEGRSTWQVQPDARLSTSVELGARADGGDADEGAGIEMGAGVEYDNTRLGLSAALRVQGLLAHQQNGFEEWGASLNIRLDPGVPGRGLALALTPEWGQASSGAAQALWESDRALQNAGLAQRPSAQLDLDLSYGMNGMTQLTPFAKLALADGIARHLRMGLRVERADGLALEVFAGRNASTYSAPELLLGLSGRLRF